MVTKLDLDKVTSRNPKEIEILLPYASDDDDAEGSSNRFAQESFSGLWSVLAPYVKSGRVTSPSGKLERSTSQGDWRRFTFSAQDSDAITDEVDHRLSMSSRSGTHTRVDGIIAMNDFVASGVVKELEALKYTGSSADVNPSISVSGIVNNLVGKRDLNRSSVPKPPRQSTDAGSGNDASEEKVNSRWPIVTGYGAYTDSLPQIVNGKQWMTGTEPRTALANDIAGACTWMNAGNSAASFAPSSTMSIDGVRTRTITQTPVAVSAANLKRELIDTGYVSMADAGL
jgi:ABC-type xylose transport system substrate-binding protein